MNQESVSPVHNELFALILTQGLSEAEQQMWQTVVPQLTTDEVQALVDAVRDDPTQLAYLTKNLQMKVTALQNNDQAAWDDVVADEEAFLKTK